MTGPHLLTIFPFALFPFVKLLQVFHPHWRDSTSFAQPMSLCHGSRCPPNPNVLRLHLSALVTTNTHRKHLTVLLLQK